MKRSGFSLWEIIGTLALILVFAAIAYPVFAPVRDPARRPSCANKLKQIGLGLAQYANDYNEHLPLVASSAAPGPYGWAESLHVYISDREIYQCPSENHEGASPASAGYTDYWFNSNLSGRAWSTVKVPAHIFAFGDGNDGGDLTDARYNLSALPVAWISNQKSPAYRHGGAANYAFLDGHVKRLTPAEITAGTATFLPK